MVSQAPSGDSNETREEPPAGIAFAVSSSVVYRPALITRRSTTRTTRAISASTPTTDATGAHEHPLWRPEDLDRLDIGGSSTAHSKHQNDSQCKDEVIEAEEKNTVEVYVHRVRRDDSLARIILTYGIAESVLKRCNRIWSSDVFPSVLLLPVEHCKSRETKLLDIDDDQDRSSRTGIKGHHRAESAPAVTLEHARLKAQANTAVTTPRTQLTIHRTVTITGVGEVDVARVARSSLTYFPPAKNKDRGELRAGRYSSLARVSMERERSFNGAQSGHQTAGQWNEFSNSMPELSPARLLVPAVKSPRASFESVRSTGSASAAAHLLENAYNGTHKMIKRFKDRKIPQEIDLIEL
ncbi:hypothetical protein PYCC9005_000801 [Savitreella phatthalungensis]